MIISSRSLDNDLPVVWACSFPGMYLKDTGAQVLGKRRLVFPSTSQLKKKKKKNVYKHHTESPQQMLTASTCSVRHSQEIKQVEQPNAACCWKGVRSVAKKDIKWNIKAADTKQTSPGNRDSTQHHHGACLAASLY